MEKVNLAEQFERISEFWAHVTAGEVNGAQIRLVRVKGEFIWHHHEHEDEMFLVIEGRLCIQFRDREVFLDPGEFLIVPRGVEHRPVAGQEARVMLVEPASTLNTGNVINERTRQPSPI